MERHAPALQLDVKTKTIARQILVAAVRNGLSMVGPEPQGYAGAVIFVAGKRTGRKLTQTAISEQMHISDETLRTRRKEIRRYLVNIPENSPLR